MTELSRKIKSINPKSILISLGYRMIFFVISLAVGVGVYGFSTKNFIRVLNTNPEVLAFLIGFIFVIFSQVDYDGESTEIEFMPWKMMVGVSFLMLVFFSLSYFLLNIEDLNEGILLVMVISIYIVIFFYIIFGDFNKIISDYTKTSGIRNIPSYIITFVPIYLLIGILIYNFIPDYRTIYVKLSFVIVFYSAYYHSRLATTAHIMKGYSTSIPSYIWVIIPISGSLYVLFSILLNTVTKLGQVSLIVAFMIIIQTVVFTHNSEWKDIEDEKTVNELQHDIISLVSDISEEEIEIKVLLNKYGVIDNIEEIESKIEENRDKIKHKKLREIEIKINKYKEKTEVVE